MIIDRTPQHALEGDDEDSDPERGDEEVDAWFHRTGNRSSGSGEGEGERERGREEGLNSALVHKLFSQHPHLYNRQYPEIPDATTAIDD